MFCPKCVSEASQEALDGADFDPPEIDLRKINRINSRDGDTEMQTLILQGECSVCGTKIRAEQFAVKNGEEWDIRRGLM